MGVAVLVAAGFVLPFLQDPVVNEWRMLRLGWTLDRAEHPPGSQRVLRSRALGVLYGNGNHCDYIVLELRLSRAGRSRVEALYAAQSYQSPVSGERLPFGFQWLDAARGPRLELPDCCNRPERWDLPPELPRDQVYALWASDQDYSDSIDPRCN